MKKRMEEYMMQDKFIRIRDKKGGWLREFFNEHEVGFSDLEQKQEPEPCQFYELAKHGIN